MNETVTRHRVAGVAIVMGAFAEMNVSGMCAANLAGEVWALMAASLTAGNPGQDTRPSTGR